MHVFPETATGITQGSFKGVQQIEYYTVRVQQFVEYVYYSRPLNIFCDEARREKLV